MRKTPSNTPGLKACKCRDSRVETFFSYDEGGRRRLYYVQCQSCGSGTQMTTTRARAQHEWNTHQLAFDGVLTSRSTSCKK